MDLKAAGPGCLVLLSALSSGAACGTRSALPVCTRPGETRSCANACGEGTQTCVDDAWGECVVPVATRSCSNDCGTGSQTCAAGAWSACMVPVATRACASRRDAGTETCTGGAWSPCDAPLPGPPTIAATIRDFSDTHPDFESDGGIGLDPGIVAPDLDPLDRPVYAPGLTATRSTHGPTYFYEWYHDTAFTVLSPDASTAPEINMTTPYGMTLGPDAGPPGTYAFEGRAFFPIDNRLLGNQGKSHNFDFTLALEADFVYTGGETITVASDDDSWVFINHKLALDLGGIHQVTAGSIALDTVAPALGLQKGGTYPMHLFYAERHVLNAALRIEVPAADFGVCP